MYLFYLIFSRTKILLGHNLRKSNAQTFSEKFHLYTCENYIHNSWKFPQTSLQSIFPIPVLPNLCFDFCHHDFIWPLLKLCVRKLLLRIIKFLVCFIQHNVFETVSVVFSLDEYSTIHLLIHYIMDIWIASSLRPLWLKLQRSIICNIQDV